MMGDSQEAPRSWPHSGESTAANLKSPEIETRPNLSDRLETTWLYEILGLVLSAAALATTIALLDSHDGHRVPDWGIISFNAVISVLAIIFKLGAIYGATNSLSQMKWTWLGQQDRRLIDFKLFDDGSRGVLGAAGLIFRLRFQGFSTLASLAILLGVALEPFTQNLIHLYEAGYHDNIQQARLARAETYVSLGPNSLSGTPDSLLTVPAIDPTLRANIYASIYQPTLNGPGEPLFGCPTGNCTWEPFTTLGFCATCVDISSSLNRSCAPNSTECKIVIPGTDRYCADEPLRPDNPPECKVAIPGGANLSVKYYGYDNWQTHMVINSTRSANALVLTNTTTPFPVYQSLRAAGNPHQMGRFSNSTRFRATECALVPCVRTINASVLRGVYRETSRQTWFQATTVSLNGSGDITLSPTWTPDTDVSPEQKFTIGSQVVNAMQRSHLLGDQWIGLVQTIAGGKTVMITSSPSAMTQNDALQSLFYANFTDTSCGTPDDSFACAFHALAGAVTRAIRNAPFLANGTSTTGVAIGTVNASGVFVRVDWGWIALPIIVWVLSLVVVIMAARGARGFPLWKDNGLPLALLFRQTRDWSDEEDLGVSASNANLLAERYRVRLIKDGGRVKLVGRLDDSKITSRKPFPYLWSR